MHNARGVYSVLPVCLCWELALRNGRGLCQLAAMLCQRIVAISSCNCATLHS
jgi:hypothetical protein